MQAKTIGFNYQKNNGNLWSAYQNYLVCTDDDQKMESSISLKIQIHQLEQQSQIINHTVEVIREILSDKKLPKELTDNLIKLLIQHENLNAPKIIGDFLAKNKFSTEILQQLKTTAQKYTPVYRKNLGEELIATLAIQPALFVLSNESIGHEPTNNLICALAYIKYLPAISALEEVYLQTKNIYVKRNILLAIGFIGGAVSANVLSSLVNNGEVPKSLYADMAVALGNSKEISVLETIKTLRDNCGDDEDIIQAIRSARRKLAQ